MKKVAALLVSVITVGCSSMSHAWKDYGINMGSCAPHSGWQSLKENTSPLDFWTDVGIKISMTVDYWRSDSDVCYGIDGMVKRSRLEFNWCALTRQNMYKALIKCSKTADYMVRQNLQGP
jgi:hypothetical protein